MNDRASGAAFRIIEARRLRDLFDDVFRSLDVPDSEIRMVADALMEATLSGYNAHGVMRVPKYADQLQDGTIVAGAAFEIIRQTAASAYVDAGRGLGQVTATRAVNLACAKAADTGIGCVSTRNSNDIGRLGSYLFEPARSGFLSILVANDTGGLLSVAPHGGAERFFSTNPIAAGIPTDDEPIVIDMATAATSRGSLRMAANRDSHIAEGWLIDRQGQSVIKPDRFFKDPKNVALLPLGGLLCGHKGFALQLLVDVLAGAIGGAGTSTGHDSGIEANAMFTIAIDPEHFVSRSRFIEMVSDMVRALKTVNTLPGVDEIVIPGHRAARERRRRLELGIPLDSVTCQNLQSVLERLGIAGKYHESLGAST